jgi:hypothetical protein
MGREDIFKPLTGNKSSHKICNDNGITAINLLGCLMMEIEQYGEAKENHVRY